MRTGIVSGTGLVAFLASAVASPAEGRLSVLCGAEEAWCTGLESDIERKPNIDVSMVRKSSGETLVQVLAEKEDPKVHVWWSGTGDPQLQAAAEGLLETCKSGNEPDLLLWAQKPIRLKLVDA